MLDQASGGKGGRIECYFGMGDKGKDGNATPDNVPIYVLGESKKPGTKPLRTYDKGVKQPGSSLTYALEDWPQVRCRVLGEQEVRGRHLPRAQTGRETSPRMRRRSSRWRSRNTGRTVAASKVAASRVPAVLGKIEPLLNLLGINL